MNYFVIPLLIACIVIGLCLGIYAYRDSRPIFFGLETSWKKRLSNAIYNGISSSMIFMSIILIVGLIEPKYNWSLKNILLFAAFSGFPGLIVTLGSIWQFFIVNRYRKKIIHSINRQDKERKNK